MPCDPALYRLVEPAVSLERAFRVFEAAYAAARETCDSIHEAHMDHFPRYVRRLNQFTRGVGIPEGSVPQTTFWMLREDRDIVAMGRVRHRLTRTLIKEGGHIGYTVSPLERRKGHGELLCALLIREAWARLDAPRLLITCDSDNTGSARIIRKNGGVFDGEVTSTYSGKAVSRYWIYRKPE